MSKYTGPKIRIIRRLGVLPGLTRKIIKNRIKTPGQHGKISLFKSKRFSLSDDYKERLFEKQKVRFNYGITEQQLISYYKYAKSLKKATGNALLELIEFRLDCILYRLGFAPSIPAARQFINHGHVLVNNRLVTIPSFNCDINDIISIKEAEKSKNLISSNFKAEKKRRVTLEHHLKRINYKDSHHFAVLPKHLQTNTKKLEGKIIGPINRKDVLIKVNELKIVEYYSR